MHEVKVGLDLLSRLKHGNFANDPLLGSISCSYTSDFVCEHFKSIPTFGWQEMDGFEKQREEQACPMEVPAAGKDP